MKNYKKKYQHLKHQAIEASVVEERAGDFNIHRCLYCYEELNDTKATFHQACNKKFFGQLETPLLAYSKQDLEQLASQVVQSQMTVTGVQAKVSLSMHRKEANNMVKKMTIVGLYGDYILKPPSEYYPFLPEVEDLTMHLAEVCGLQTVPHTLCYLQDGTRCYLTKRVDRTRKGKLHMEDMCQLTERLTEDKYKGSHEQVAKAILKYSANPLLDVTNFYEVVVFSYLTGNADMHLKNFSLLEKPGLGYVLAPAYDLLSTALVNPEDTEELALTLNGKKRKLRYNDFLAAFENSGLSKKILDTMLENFYYCVFEMMDFVQKSILNEEYKNEYCKLLEQRAKQLLGTQFL
jgi:serine/threonine-protein kinase HipA